MGGNHSFWHLLVQLDMFGYPISLYYHDNSRRMKSMLGLIITAIVITLGTVQVVDLANRVGDPDYQKVLSTEFNIQDIN